MDIYELSVFESTFDHLKSYLEKENMNKIVENLSELDIQNFTKVYDEILDKMEDCYDYLGQNVQESQLIEESITVIANVCFAFTRKEKKILAHMHQSRLDFLTQFLKHREFIKIFNHEIKSDHYTIISNLIGYYGFLKVDSLSSLKVLINEIVLSM